MKGNMKMSKMIIVEGPQGTGKTTLTNYLRDNLSSSNLYRLSGQKDKTITGKDYSKKMYYALIEYLEKMQQIPMDIRNILLLMFMMI
jgi:thymidylate kinase